MRIAAATRKLVRPLRRRADIGLGVGTVVNDHKVAKHFELTITEDSFSDLRRTDSFEREARLDGIYIIRTSQHADAMSAADTVLAYKDLARVERALRTLKSVDRQICPLNHWIKLRVRAHVFLRIWPTMDSGTCAGLGDSPVSRP